MKEEKNATLLSQLSNIDIYDNSVKKWRKTSIVCTIGPASNSKEMLAELRTAGMNVVRMNFSHGTHEYHKNTIEQLKESFKLVPGRQCAIALDTKGPEVRTGIMKEGLKEIKLVKDQGIIVTTDIKYKEACDEKQIYLDYSNLCNVISVDGIIFIDDGLISLKVLKIVDDKTLECIVVNSGSISSHKGVNLPNVDVDLPAVSEKDAKDLKFGVDELGIDMVFASFIRKPEDVLAVRKVLGDKGKHVKIISKIENYEGVKKFKEILEVTDGVMVARGDLGIEIEPEKVFLAQKMMIAACNLAGKPVICATQMLESMTVNPRPTRAEVSDVANAVLDGADCVMLSGETAKGKYPVQAVTMMHNICREAEAGCRYVSFYNDMRKSVVHPLATSEVLASSVVNATLEQDIKGIVVLTRSGSSAKLVSKYRPECAVFGVTRDQRSARQMHLYRGIISLHYPYQKAEEKEWQADVDKRVRYAMTKGIHMGLLKQGDKVIAVQGWKTGAGFSNTLRILSVKIDNLKEFPDLVELYKN